MKKVCGILLVVLIAISICVVPSARYYYTKSHCDNIQQLSDLVGVDLEKCDIKDITWEFNDEYKSTSINIWINQGYDEKVYKNFTSEANISRGKSEELENNNIQKDDISYSGIGYKDFVVFSLFPTPGTCYMPYPIYLIEFEGSESGEKSCLITTDIPHKIKINVAEICQ